MISERQLALLVWVAVVIVFVTARDLRNGRRSVVALAAPLESPSLPGWLPAVALVATVAVWIACALLDRKGVEK